MKFGKAVLVGIAMIGLAAASAPADAAANLVVNGDFEQFSSTTGSQLVSPNSNGGGTLTGWTNAGYTFLFTPGSADKTGTYSTEYTNTLYLWGPGGAGNTANGVANGLAATSPTGGNFLASDGAYQQGALSQTISGLTVGNTYNLSFYWAAGQQYSYTGATTESWGVTFGSETYTTPIITNPSEGFTPWRQQVFAFTATSATQTLSFLAAGAPSGTPPMSLLDGVVLMAPEPSTWAIMLVGLVGAAVSLRVWRRPLAMAPGLQA